MSDFGPVVSGEWLAEHVDDVRVVDIRWYADGRSAVEAYLQGHIPGAVRLDLDDDLAAPPSVEAGRHPMPTPEQFAAVLGRVGIAEGTPVVAYDDNNGGYAARLWWMLHVLGEPVAVLEGGLAAWRGQLATDVPEPTAVERAPRQWPADRFVEADDLGGRASVLYDARIAARFAGDGDPALDPRPGHIPGAMNVPWPANLGPDGRLRSPESLREMYAAAVDRGAVAYCGSGVTACFDLLAMHVAGIENTALYAGSWSQWAADPSRPAGEGGS